MGEEGTRRYRGGYPERGSRERGFPRVGILPGIIRWEGALKGSHRMARDGRGTGIPTTSSPLQRGSRLHEAASFYDDY